MAESRAQRWRAPLLIFAISICTRVPFQSHMLQHWDAVNFALALERFDLAQQRPHPPGTLVFFLGCAKLLCWLGLDANSALVRVSTIGSAATAALLCGLGAAWFDPRVGWIAGLLALSSPLLWHLGEVGLSYSTEGVCVVSLLWLCGGVRRRRRPALWLSAFLLGFSGGLRPNTPLFLLPMWGLSLAAGRFDWRSMLRAVALAAFGVATWLAPLLWLAGGLQAYVDVVSSWSAREISESGVQVIALQGLRMLVFTATALGAAAIPLGWRLWIGRDTLVQRLRTDWRAQLLTAAIIPGAAFLVLVHLRQPGHIMTIVPPLLLAAAVAIRAVDHHLFRNPARAFPLIAGAVVAANAVFFLAAPGDIGSTAHTLARLPTRAAIADYDAELEEQMAAVRRYSPADTAVVMRGRSRRIPSYYLREYYDALGSVESEEHRVLPDHIRRLVWIDPSGDLPSGVPVIWLRLPSSAKLPVLIWDREQRLVVGSNTAKVQAR